MDSLPRLWDAFLHKVQFQLESDVDALLNTVHTHTVIVLGNCDGRAVAAAANIFQKEGKSSSEARLAKFQNQHPGKFISRSLKYRRL